MQNRSVIALVACTIAAGCAVNPVTGNRDLILVSGEQEVAMGTQNYAPMQQAQGGPYDIDPALTVYVQAVGRKLAAASGVDLPYEFTILNNSVPNAWALPGGKIAINRGLITELGSEAELAAVLGHEIVHAAARHTAQQMSKGMVLQGLVVATSVATSDSNYGDMAVGGAAVAAQLLSTKYGREAELESDKYGMRYMSKAGYDPQGAVTLQQTFVRLSEGRNEDWLSGLFASHPPSRDRVAANRETAANLPPGGTLGAERFREAIARTIELKPAYDAYDEGRQALGEKQTDKALTLVNEALGRFSGEAHFHALRGDIRLVTDEFDMAVKNYNRAIERRGDFFYYHLQRGLARERLGQAEAAVADLERSVELLPTAPAHYHLGRLKQQRGDTAAAIEHYKIVAKSEGEYARKATEALVRLELASQPAAYIASACGNDGSGQLVLQVRNDTPVDVTGVRVQLRYVDSGGAERQLTRNFSGVIAAGKVLSTRTGLAPYPGTRCVSTVVAAVAADQIPQ